MAQSQSAKGKFPIRPFRPQTQLDNKAAKEVWSFLSRAFDEIYNKNASHLSYEELYR